MVVMMVIILMCVQMLFKSICPWTWSEEKHRCEASSFCNVLHMARLDGFHLLPLLAKSFVFMSQFVTLFSFRAAKWFANSTTLRLRDSSIWFASSFVDAVHHPTEEKRNSSLAFSEETNFMHKLWFCLFCLPFWLLPVRGWWITDIFV